jgi:4-hydroxyproline epimerase
MACLAADGKLGVGYEWRQEGILGTVFTGRIERAGERVLPFIRGSAWVMAVTTLLFEEDDPFAGGIPAPGELGVSGDAAGRFRGESGE